MVGIRKILGVALLSAGLVVGGIAPAAEAHHGSHRAIKRVMHSQRVRRFIRSQPVHFEFTATLTGANEVPGPADPDGLGAAKIAIGQKRVCFVIVVVGIELPATAAHIHQGVAGVAGDVVVTLEPPTEIGTSGIGLSMGCVRGVDPAVLRAIVGDPAGYYVNVHNAEFPSGALRGQLEAV